MIPEINTEVITLVILMSLLAMMLGNIISPGKGRREIVPAIENLTEVPEGQTRGKNAPGMIPDAD
jgi:hypothetical protein